MSDHAHVTPEVVELATGAEEARQLTEAIAHGRLDASHAWHAFVELQARHGKNAPALKSFIVHLAKQARRAGGV
jgi:hypothetical protein